MPAQPRPTLPLATVDLAALAELAAIRAAVEPRGAPCLVRVRIVDAEVELGWLPLPPGGHPLDELVGRTAPDDWEAIGVVAHGVAHRVDDDSGVPPVPVVTTHLVGRDGSWATRCELPGRDPLAAAGTADDPDRVAGRLDDACRRVLALPTAPPDVGTDLLFALQWLDAIVDAAASASRRVATWSAAAALHPAVSALLPDAGAEGLDPVALATKTHQLATWRDWPVLRRSCAAGTWSTPDLDPTTAAWLDDGAFSRWALGAFPDLDDLLATATDLLPESVIAAVTDTLVLAGLAP